jgi:hypothetical protein
MLVIEVAGLVALTASSYAFRMAILSSDLSNPGMYFTWLPARTDQFAAGMALAVASAWWATHGTEPRWVRHRALPWLSWAGALVAFWAVATQLDLSKNPAPFDFSGSQQIGQQLCYSLVGFFLVVPAALAPLAPSGVRSLLAWGPIAWRRVHRPLPRLGRHAAQRVRCSRAVGHRRHRDARLHPRRDDRCRRGELVLPRAADPRPQGPAPRPRAPPGGLSRDADRARAGHHSRRGRRRLGPRVHA